MLFSYVALRIIDAKKCLSICRKVAKMNNGSDDEFEVTEAFFSDSFDLVIGKLFASAFILLYPSAQVFLFDYADVLLTKHNLHLNECSLLGLLRTISAAGSEVIINKINKLPFFLLNHSVFALRNSLFIFQLVTPSVNFSAFLYDINNFCI